MHARHAARRHAVAYFIPYVKTARERYSTRDHARVVSYIACVGALGSRKMISYQLGVLQSSASRIKTASNVDLGHSRTSQHTDAAHLWLGPEHWGQVGVRARVWVS